MKSYPPLGSSGEPSSWLVIATVAAGTVIAVVLALAMTMMSEGGETRPRAAVGQLFSAPVPDDEIDMAEVLLPWQRLDVGVGQPVRELPELMGAPADVAPPAGGRFVPVRTEPVEDGALGEGPAFVATERPLRTEARFVLTADGTEYPIDGAGGLTEDPNALQTSESSTRWVAVEGDPSTIEVTVVTDGQEQTVHGDGTVTRGRAAELDDLPTHEELGDQEPVDCGASRRVDDSDLRIETSNPEECRVTASLRTPFVDGLGWAPKGKEYLVVQIAPERPAAVESPDGEDRRWAVTTRIDGRLGSTQPRAGPRNLNALNEGTAALQSIEDPEQLVFEVPEGRSSGDLVVGLDIRAEPKDPFAGTDDTERLRLQWTIPAGRLP